jgi:hypothetical protein
MTYHYVQEAFWMMQAQVMVLWLWHVSLFNTLLDLGESLRRGIGSQPTRPLSMPLASSSDLGKILTLNAIRRDANHDLVILETLIGLGDDLTPRNSVAIIDFGPMLVYGDGVEANTAGEASEAEEASDTASEKTLVGRTTRPRAIFGIEELGLSESEYDREMRRINGLSMKTASPLQEISPNEQHSSSPGSSPSRGEDLPALIIPRRRQRLRPDGSLPNLAISQTMSHEESHEEPTGQNDQGPTNGPRINMGGQSPSRPSPFPGTGVKDQAATQGDQPTEGQAKSSAKPSDWRRNISEQTRRVTKILAPKTLLSKSRALLRPSASKGKQQTAITEPSVASPTSIISLESSGLESPPTQLE